MIQVDHGGARLTFTRLSDEQRAALADTREVAVTAGAGAGKTTTLSARFVALHDRILRARGSTDPAAVLVMTFSERAAEEMRERCYQMVSAVARASVGGPAALRVGWESLRDRFAGATITTFHGFCARIVREFGPEADVSPAYTILEEAEATSLVLEAAGAAVDRRLDEPGPAITLLLRTFGGRARLCEAVAALVTSRAELLPRLQAHADGRLPAPVLAAACGVPAADAARFLDDELLPFARSLVAITGAIETPFLDNLRDLLARAALAEADDPLGRSGLYAEGLALCTTSKGEPRTLAHHTSTGTEAAWGPRKGATRKALLAPLQATIEGWRDRITSAAQAPNRHDRTLASVLEALATVALDAIERHREALRAREALDFTELQVRARAVLEAPGGAPLAALRARHRYVMVDEFQDTDGLQWSIVEGLTRPDHGPRDRLFFVGDAKQAIYGFRGGDVEVFSRALTSVAASEEGLGCSLTINRRSRPELITFFNDLFRLALGDPAPHRPGWEAPYEPLAAGRTDTGGTVRWLVAGAIEAEGEEEEALDAVQAEARAVARLVAREILPGRGSYGGADLRDTTQFPSPPIALLLRRRTKLAVWEAALREAGVPFLVLGGMGFWSRPEVLDVVNLLVALTRADPVARVGALRSPLFGVDDDALLAVHRLGRLRTFGEGPAPAELGAQVLVAWERWARLLAQSRHASTAELIHAALEESRQAWQQTWLHPDGRSLANLGRLLDLADAHDLQGHDLAAFASFAATQVENDAREGEAPPPRSDARVVISTVHGSKGLEYPVVILPELDARPRAGGFGALTKVGRGGEWELACAVPAGEGPLDTMATPGLLATLQASARAREHAEYLRLFYVACTRARDHLVLVGPRTDGSRSPPRWADLVSAWAATGEPGAWWTVDETTAVAPDAGDPASGAAPSPERAAPPEPTPPPPPDLARRVAPLPTRLRVEVAPSSLALAAEDPVLWRRRHLLGVEAVERPWAPAGGGTSAYAAAVGKVVHALLEDDALDDDGAIQARWLTAAREAALSPADLEAGLAAVRAQAQVLAASPVIRALFHRATWRELPVLWQREGSPVVLAGRLDLLCRDPEDGAWMVVDYKSHGQRGGDAAASDTARFRLQLLAYSVAASKVLEARGQPPVARGAVLFTRTAQLVRLPDWTAGDHDELERRLEELGRLVEAWAAEE